MFCNFVYAYLFYLILFTLIISIIFVNFTFITVISASFGSSYHQVKTETDYQSMLQVDVSVSMKLKSVPHCKKYYWLATRTLENKKKLVIMGKN